MRLLVLAMAVAFIVGGCGSSRTGAALNRTTTPGAIAASTTAPSAAPSASPTQVPSATPTQVAVPQGGSGQHGYVGQYDNGVEFIQWTESNGQLTGQLQVVYVDQSNPLVPKSANEAFTGIISGENVSLNVAGFGTWTGTLRDGTLSIVTPDSNGFLMTSPLHSGTVDDYNKAVVAFRNTLQERAPQAQAAAAAATAAAYQEEVSSTCAWTGTVGVVSHDATIIFTGPNAEISCIKYFFSGPPDVPYEARVADTSLPVVCRIQLQSTIVTVVDTELQLIARNDICPYVSRLVGQAFLGLSFAMTNGKLPVESVVSGGPAGKAGVQQNDVLTALDGKPVSTADDLKNALSAHQPGDVVTLSISRSGTRQDLKVTLG